MRGLKFAIGLLCIAVFAGGCVMEPLDPEFEEEELGSVAEGVSTAPTSATQSGGTATAAPMVDSVLSNKSDDGKPEKPQPDPWSPEIRRGSSSTTTTPTP